MQDSQIKKDDILTIKIDDIDTGDNRSLIEENVLALAKSFNSFGQIMPIIVKRNPLYNPENNKTKVWKLVSGGHRVAACIQIKKKDINAIVFEGDDKDGKLLQFHENTIRAGLQFLQKIEAAKWIQENLANPVGRKLASIDNEFPKTVGNLDSDLDNEFPKTVGNLDKNTVPAHTEKLVVEHGIFGNKETYRQAMKVYEDCIPEVYSLIDSGAISVYYAFKTIVSVPKKKQKSLLYNIGVDASVDKSQVRNKIKKRLKKQRNEAADIPENPNADPIYNVVRVSPDWQNELHSDIRELPVNDYLSDVGVLFLECPNREVATALELITKWGLTYQAIITVYNQKSPTEKSVKGLPVPWYISQKSYHILIAQKDPELCGPTVEDIPAVLNRQKPEESLFNIVSEICPIEKELRLDMSGTVPVDGWKVWKIDYAKKD